VSLDGWGQEDLNSGKHFSGYTVHSGSRVNTKDSYNSYFNGLIEAKERQKTTVHFFHAVRTYSLALAKDISQLGDESDKHVAEQNVADN
jgi:hypothetical protein